MKIRSAHIALACVVLALATAAGAAAQDTQPLGQTPSPAAPGSAQDSTEWYINKPIKGFQFTGLITVKESDLQAVLKP